ncbi:MAG: hypothetical protein AVDCRST_MAG11-288, partial [uncultured Gemmatimonadaceae bacterium]
ASIHRRQLAHPPSRRAARARDPQPLPPRGRDRGHRGDGHAPAAEGAGAPL